MLKDRVSIAAPVALLSLLSACSSVPPAPPQPGAASAPGATTGGAPTDEATPLPNAPGEQAEQHAPTRQHHLTGPANALVAQAHEQASKGNYEMAIATLERAQRVDQVNPLVWIEMGQVRLQAGNSALAHSFGQKALQLSSGDPGTQARAWQLIADSLKAQGKDPESMDAQRRADALSPH